MNLNNFDPPSINNSREIIRGYLESFKKAPSERLTQHIETLSGLTADWSDADWGNGPKHD